MSSSKTVEFAFLSFKYRYWLTTLLAKYLKSPEWPVCSHTTDCQGSILWLMNTAFVSLSVKHHLFQVKTDFKKQKFQTPEPLSFLLHSTKAFHFL